MEENKKTKSELLTEKCNKLVEKLETEKSPIKRALYSVKLKILIAKIEKELEIQNIQENYGIEREEIKYNFANYRKNYRKEIGEFAKNIRIYQNKLARNAEYDPYSKEFLYPKSEIEREGGIDNFIDSLRDDDDYRSKDLANIIEATLEDRRILEEMQEELSEKQNVLENLDTMRKKEIKKSEKEEKALIKKEKIGIFQSIKMFFDGMIAEFKANKEKRNNIKEINKFEKEEITNIKKEKKNLEKDAKSEYEKACQEAYEKYLETIENYKSQYMEEQNRIEEENKNKDKETREFAKELRTKIQNQPQKESVNSFKEQIKNLANVQDNSLEGEVQVEEKTPERIIKGGYVDKNGTFYPLGKDGKFEMPENENKKENEGSDVEVEWIEL